MSPLVKKAQPVSMDGIDIPLKPSVPQDQNELRVPEDSFLGDSEDLLVEESPEDEESDESIPEMEIDEPVALVLTLDRIPGGLDQEEIQEPSTLEVEEPEEVEVNDNPWDWGNEVKNFVPWLSRMMQNVPRHSGRDTAGLERAIAYLEAVDREISKAVRSDLNNEIAIEAVEKARDEIQQGLERLEERLESIKSSKYPKKNKGKKKKAEQETPLVKEAQKAAYYGGIIVTVPLFISHLARVCINGMVSGGHDIEDMFDKLSKRYKLTDREQMELIQLLQDMNYTVRRDRGIPLDEDFNPATDEGFDWSQNYTA